MSATSITDLKYLDARHYDRVVRRDTTVIKPDGQLLLIYARDVLPPPPPGGFDVVKRQRPRSKSRSHAAGGKGVAVRSVPLGFLPKDSRVHHCRKSEFTRNHAAEFAALHPFFLAVSEKYRELAPGSGRRSGSSSKGSPRTS